MCSAWRAPSHQAQAQIALLDATGLPHLAAVHAHEVGGLGVERTRCSARRRRLRDRAPARLEEVRLDGSLPAAASQRNRCHACSSMRPRRTRRRSRNTHAGDACPQRMTCDGSPLPQYGVPSTCARRRVADQVEAAPEARRDAAVVRILDDVRRACRSRSARPRSQPNWNLLRESSIDQLLLVSIITPRSIDAHELVEARVARLEVEVRHAVDRRPVPVVGARVRDARQAGARLRDRAAERAQQDAVLDQVARARRACRRRPSRSSRAPPAASDRT